MDTASELRLHRSLRLYRRLFLPALLLGWLLGAATAHFHHVPLRDELAALEQRLPLPKGFLVSPMKESAP